MKKLCIQCGYIGRAKSMVKGSFLMELILWGAFGIILLLTLGMGFLFGLIPLIYSIWRITSGYKACPECKTIGMISVDSPVAIAIIAKS